jgi:two-component system nitrogen regulation response regulator GlnG/two-component system response regulator HydG
MARASTTVDANEDSPSGRDSRPEPVPTLVIAWCAHEPWRVGEVAPLPPGSPPLVLGRGAPEDDDPRLRFFRPRRGALEPTGPLSSPTLSRRQLRLANGRDAIEIEQIGTGILRINGARVASGVVAPGDVVSLRRSIVLVCVGREPSPRAARALPFALGSFGEPDACGILGESPAVVRLREQIAFAIDAEAHVLVTGESGTGKELVASALHRASSRAARSFVSRNAAALPPSLIDAELFGNVANYPQAGMPERKGLIGAADGGTLFLDEIGELPGELQAHLLRVLDRRGEYHRLGEATARRSDFRLVAATNRERSSLKHDLASRLLVNVRAPSLAERREDIPLLARHLVIRLAEQSPAAAARFVSTSAHGRAARLSAAFVEHLVQRSYPGNVRELEAVLLRAMSESHGEELELPPEDATLPSAVASRPASSPQAREPSAEPSVEAVRAALAVAGGSVTGAARSLGLSRYTLYRVLRKHGLRVASGAER